MQRQAQSNEERPQYFSRNRLTRGRGLRKTTGCLTCRRRHVKCDESRPRCKACVRINSECSWPPSRTSTSARQQGSEKSSSNGSDEKSTLSQARDEAAATLIEFRDSWQEPQQDSSGQSYDGQTDIRFDANASQSDFTSPDGALMLGTSPDLSSLTTNVYEWVRSDADIVGTPLDFDVDDAANVWANLLLKDASSRAKPGADLGSPLNGRVEDQILGSFVPQMLPVDPQLSASEQPPPASLPQPPPTARLQLDQRGGSQAWQSENPLTLAPHEVPLFHDFIHNLSLWMDFFDPKRPFGTLVPHLAMRNRGLLNAILALSIRHLSLNVRFQPLDSRPQDPLDALPFYFTTLHYIREAMQHDTYKNSLELLATASIVSAYEMLDGSRQDWERHLRGLSCIQQSQGIHGDSGGLKQAVWWTWLCQDVWAAWREGRKPFMTWKPDRSLSQLDGFELAARSVYLFAQAVGFCSREELALGRTNPAARLAKAESLQRALNDWHRHLPPDFRPLPLKEQASKGPFPPIWINPPSFATAVQLYHCSQVLIMANSPCLGGMTEYKKQKAQIDQHVLTICGIAMHLKADPASVMCSQALFIAGLFVTEKDQRQAILDLLDGCWRRAGWPLQSLGVELEQEWHGQGG